MSRQNRIAGLREGLRKTGITDGLWTLSASLGSKLQMVVLLAVVTRFAGVAATGNLLLAIALGVLLSSLVDAGLSPQVARSFANGTVTDRGLVLWPALMRMGSAALLAFALSFLTRKAEVAGIDAVGWAAATAFYAASFGGAAIATQLAYGSFRFKSGSALNGFVRALTIPFLFAIAWLDLPLQSYVFVLALAELIIAVVQYHLVRREVQVDSSARKAEKRHLQVRSTWRFGVGSLANNLMNRSDTVAVSLFASTAVVGLYGLASQVENAMTTAALVPAGAVVAYTARAKNLADVDRITIRVGGLVAAIYVVAAIPALIFTEFFVHLIFGSGVEEMEVFRLCIIAGLFSCLAGILMQRLEGVGSQSALAVVWTLIAVVAVSALAIGAGIGGATGAGVAALVRDITFFTLAAVAVLRQRKKERVRL